MHIISLFRVARQTGMLCNRNTWWDRSLDSSCHQTYKYINLHNLFICIYIKLECKQQIHFQLLKGNRENEISNRGQEEVKVESPRVMKLEKKVFSHQVQMYVWEIRTEPSSVSAASGKPKEQIGPSALENKKTFGVVWFLAFRKKKYISIFSLINYKNTCP